MKGCQIIIPLLAYGSWRLKCPISTVHPKGVISCQGHLHLVPSDALNTKPPRRQAKCR